VAGAVDDESKEAGFGWVNEDVKDGASEHHEAQALFGTVE
jgi:hypothetical protein